MRNRKALQPESATVFPAGVGGVRNLGQKGVGGVPKAGEEGAGSGTPKVLELYNILQPKKHKEVGVNIRSITTGTRIKSWKFKPLLPPLPT